eukprot:CAMPEP_0194207124 /NCGR_PEP_ID=MMETSP0156-20130528/5972_1 /TAXON_ID=33649 /ORGANISM="Thalassionema nitzschioides, Strain L26-B" /LENGTH=939 /DNA_ID=CAMNT_0038933825 /DNA_START=46 /DNA_END=2863 /DNA_ORIENTATION=-
MLFQSTTTTTIAQLLLLSLLLLLSPLHNHAFQILPQKTTTGVLLFADTETTTTTTTTTPVAAVAVERDFNAVRVAKEGGVGERTAGQQAYDQNLSLGAPRARSSKKDGASTYLTDSGKLEITSSVRTVEFEKEAPMRIEQMVDLLDDHKGVLLTSSYEFPGRYARWSLGFVDPPLEISGRSSSGQIRALNERGLVLLPLILEQMKELQESNVLVSVETTTKLLSTSSSKDDDESDDSYDTILLQVAPPPPVGTFTEEERSRQPSLFSVVRSMVDLFRSASDHQLGLYGGFGYDLTFQFEPIDLVQERNDEQRDLLLYVPDRILVVDQDKKNAWEVEYDFKVVVNNDDTTTTTAGIDRVGSVEPFEPFHDNDDNDDSSSQFLSRDTPVGDFAKSVELAKREFAVGNLFEAVLSQTFREKLTSVKPSLLFRRLRSRNPAPYGFFMNLGEQEYLVGASPEMFVRCEYVMGDDKYTNDNINDNIDDDDTPLLRVETCPISGTVARGADALEDAQRVKSLMMNAKEESELTMCTDVDRNDKSRICVPGSVKVIGRRQIEMYSRLIHTVDHVEGYLRNEFDALDAFLCHTWAVTVTGAPKTWAIQFVEEHERSPRCWYGGAVGMVGFDGSLNTGLTLRTVRVQNGVAEVRAGATLLYDSSPPAEELETELKASAMMDAIIASHDDDADATSAAPKKKANNNVGDGKSVVLIDHEDSFVHTLGNYLRQTGAQVQTLRSGPSALQALTELIHNRQKPDLVVLSPGPGNPSDFGLSTTIDFLTNHRIPAFGVCLGLQGMVEHFGGRLGVLSYPMHGKPSMVSLNTKLLPSVSSTTNEQQQGSIFTGLPESFEVARYHSLYGIREHMPDCLEMLAFTTEDGIPMAIAHKTLPFAAVQFHPESILTSPAHGLRLLENALRYLNYNDDTDDDDDDDVDDDNDTDIKSDDDD